MWPPWKELERMNLIMLHIISKNTTDRCLWFFQKIRKPVKIMAYLGAIAYLMGRRIYPIRWFRSRTMYCPQLTFFRRHCRKNDRFTLVTPDDPLLITFFPMIYSMKKDVSYRKINQVRPITSCSRSPGVV